MEGLTIAIVGLGLMGGSLAAALTAARQSPSVAPAPSFTVRGVARRAESIAAALEQGYIDEGTTDAVAGVRDADVVILGAPVRATIDLMQGLAGHFKPGCIVSDLGSTKAAIAQAMADLPPHVDPIGGHPMCGKEVSGLQAADAGLFQGRAYILTPLPRTSDRAIATLQEMIRLIGARCVILEPDRHDRLVAAVSHLPYVLAACLVNVAAGLSAEDEMLWELVSSGFRDTSRLAASEPTMMQDILMTNRENIRQMIGRFSRCLAQCDEFLAHNNEAALAEWIGTARRRREGIFQ